ncbi:unnamed protein product [Cercospora beticola]|nr:unnamed protein product [Cercospora beticola]
METCKSRTFGQGTGPPPKKARTSELRWEQSTFASLPLQATNQNIAAAGKETPRLKFVRGYVAPVTKRKEIVSSDKHEVVTASSPSIRKQGAAGNALEPLKLNGEQQRQIYQAVLMDKIALFTEIIRSYGDSQDTLLSVNKAYSYNGGSLLHCAAFVGRIEIARMLLSAGLDIDSTDKRLRTPLHDAAYGASVEIVRLLVRQGADVNAEDSYGRTALLQACYSDLGRTDEADTLQMVDILLQRGVSLDVENVWNATALCLAASEGAHLVAKRLLDRGASVNGSSKEGSITPLIAACLRGSPTIVTMLLGHGADGNRCNLRPRDLRTREWLFLEADVSSGQIYSRLAALAITCANIRGSEELCTRLLAAGADPNLGDVVPLETAIIYGYPSVIKILLDAEADPSRISDECFDTLQGLRKPKFPWLYDMREEKWALLEQYYSHMSGDKESLDSDSESEVSEEDEVAEDNENDRQSGNNVKDKVVTIDLTMVEDDSSSFYEESDEEQVHEKTAL